MTDALSINVSSLSLVHDELLATIEQAAGKLEQFVADMDSSELLQGCIEDLQQISGTLSLVQLTGADVLAREALALANEITVGEENLDKRLAALTDAFFVIPRYLEYTLQTHRVIPVLLIPAINALRQARRAETLEESYFFQVDLAGAKPVARGGSALLGEDLPVLVRRLRHMYQTGLVNVLQDKVLKSSLGMMARALQRLSAISGQHAMGQFWSVAAVAVEVLAEQEMELPRIRKQMLGALDRQIRVVQNGGVAALSEAGPEKLLKDCVYLIALSNSTSPAAKQVLDAYPHQPLGYTDQELARQGELLQGPSVNTVQSVAAVLREELNKIKDILERASQSGGAEAISDFDELLGMLNKVADILSVVRLVSASDALKESVRQVESWRDDPAAVDASSMVELADTVLYVESTVAGLQMSNLSDKALADANAIARQEIIASNQLAEAELIVLQEAESGLALVKRALNSFAQSGYDRGHIKNVVATLTSVRGGMTVLGLHRASKVVAASVSFVDQTLLQGEPPAALQHLLETFADAIIGLEYYLDAVKSHRAAGDNILEVAEESLAALGYPVE